MKVSYGLVLSLLLSVILSLSKVKRRQRINSPQSCIHQHCERPPLFYNICSELLLLRYSTKMGTSTTPAMFIWNNRYPAPSYSSRVKNHYDFHLYVFLTWLNISDKLTLGVVSADKWIKSLLLFGLTVKKCLGTRLWPNLKQKQESVNKKTNIVFLHSTKNCFSLAISGFLGLTEDKQW